MAKTTDTAPRGAKTRIKPKMTKEERRVKYTEIARKRREKLEIRKYGRIQNPTKVCYQCRQPGHTAANCPSRPQQEEQEQQAEVKVLCYKCGSTEHGLATCPIRGKGNNDLPFATCFLCQKKGHLVSKCPENQRGIYINGGCCRVCGGTDHLAGECSQKRKKGGKEQEQDSDDGGVHINDNPIDGPSSEKKTKKKLPEKEKKTSKRRVVKF